MKYCKYKQLLLVLMVVLLFSKGCSPYAIYTPSGLGPFPAVIVLHSGTGLRQSHLDYAAGLRQQGYITIVPSYCSDFSDCDHVANHYDHLRVIADAYDHLKTLPNVDLNRIGIVGFSRGGAKALSFPERYPEKKLSGIVAYYPGPIRYFNFGRPENPPILILQGELDEEAGSGWIKGFCVAQMAVDRICEFKLYPGAYHAFIEHSTRRYRGYNPSAAADAFQRTVTFLHKHVKGQL